MNKERQIGRKKGTEKTTLISVLCTILATVLASFSHLFNLVHVLLYCCLFVRCIFPIFLFSSVWHTCAIALCNLLAQFNPLNIIWIELTDESLFISIRCCDVFVVIPYPTIDIVGALFLEIRTDTVQLQRKEFKDIHPVKTGRVGVEFLDHEQCGMWMHVACYKR